MKNYIFLIKFYKNVEGGAGGKNPTPVGDGDEGCIYTLVGFGDGDRGGEGNGESGRGWGKQNPTPTRSVVMPTLITLLFKVKKISS